MIFGMRILVPQSEAVPGPVVPPDLHSNGVDGATHRYVSYAQAGAVGSAINVLPDAIDGNYLRPVGTNKPPVVGDASGVKTVQLPADSDYLLRSGMAFASEFTVAVVARLTGGGYALRADGYVIGRGGDGAFRAYGAGDSTAAGAFGPGLSGFVVLFFQRTASGQQIGYVKSGGGAFGTASAAPNAAFDDVLGIGGPGSIVRDVLEVNVWPSVLDMTKCTAHTTAMRNKYGALIASY